MVFRVLATIQGRQLKRFVPTRDAAELLAAQWGQGQAKALVTLPTRFTPDKLREAESAACMLDGSGMSLKEAGIVGNGTSFSAPTWAAWCARINQARAAANIPSVGLLNPQLYPQNGTSVFRDITTGSNGAYSAGVGYDLVTGLGVPNVANLLQALSIGFTTQPASQTPASGTNVTFTSVAAATNGATITYQG